MAQNKKQDENMFGSFASAADERKKEQQQIEATVMGTASDPGKRTTMQIAMSDEDKITIKTYAARQRKPVSEIIHEWIAEHCQD